MSFPIQIIFVFVLSGVLIFGVLFCGIIVVWKSTYNYIPSTLTSVANNNNLTRQKLITVPENPCYKSCDNNTIK